MIFSSSVMIGSGALLRTGKIPTDCPRIQSASKLRMVSTALRRSPPLPWTSTMIALRVGADDAGLEPKLSSSLIIVCAETCCSGTTVMP